MERQFDMQKRLISVLLALAMVATFALIVRAAAADDIAEVVRLTNVERAKAGKPALSAGNSKLNQAARKRAEEIVGTFSHTRPNGTGCFTVLAEYGVTSTARGENIYYGSGPYGTAAAAVDGWMSSPGHKANILDEDDYGFNQIGVGVVQSGSNTYYVQLFVKTTMVPDVTDPSAPTTTAAPPKTTKAPVTTIATSPTATKAPVTTTVTSPTATKAPATTTAAPTPTTKTPAPPPADIGFWSRLWNGLLWFFHLIFFFI